MLPLSAVAYPKARALAAANTELQLRRYTDSGCTTLYTPPGGLSQSSGAPSGPSPPPNTLHYKVMDGNTGCLARLMDQGGFPVTDGQGHAQGTAHPLRLPSVHC